MARTFIDRIKAGRDLGITDPAMTRFLMSLEESVDLVLHAFTHGAQGDIFVQKAPACTIGDLAIALSELFDVPLRTRIKIGRASCRERVCQDVSISVVAGS